jgi:hypothetical protein
MEQSLKKLTVAQLITKFFDFIEPEEFIIIFVTAQHWTTHPETNEPRPHI